MLVEMSTTQKRLLITVAILLAVLAIGGWTREQLGISSMSNPFASSRKASGPRDQSSSFSSLQGVLCWRCHLRSY